MRRIQFNLSSMKVIDRRAFFARMVVAALAGLLLVGFGIFHLYTMYRFHKNEVQQMNAYEAQIEVIDQQTAELSQSNQSIKNQWRRRADFANALIRSKNISNSKVLDLLENILPEDVWADHVEFVSERPVTVKINIVTPSYKSLFDFYKRVKDFEPVIQSEGEKDGRFFSGVQLRIKNEKL